MGAILFISQSFKAKAAVLQYKLSITITSASTNTIDTNSSNYEHYQVEKVTVLFGDGNTTITLNTLNGSGSGTVISTTDANVVNFKVSAKTSKASMTFNGNYDGGHGAIGNGKTAECVDWNYSSTYYTATINYNASKSTIVIKDNISPTVSMSGWTYGETANDPSVSGNLGNGEVTYHYKVQGSNDSTYTTTQPSNAGDYTVRATIAETENYNSGVATANFTILKADPQVTPPTAKTNLEYTGNEQELINEGSTSVGEMQYKLDDGEWSTNIPTAVNVGDYVIYYKVIGNDNYNEAGGNILVSISKKTVTITANDKTITYGDMPDNDGVSYSGFIGTDDETVLNGNLEILYNYEQFGNVGSYSIIPSGLVSSNYNIQYVNGVLSVNPLDITVTIVSKSSIYGDAQVELESSITSGELINNDTNVYSISCAVTATSDVGTYDIIGTCLNTNYNITFVGESDSYIVSKKELTITANSKTITYGDTPVNDGVSYTGFVNSETEIVLDGNLSFTYTYNQYDNVGNYLIIPNGLTSTNYDITFVNGNLTVEAKPITVTITPVTSVYGESQTELIGIADGIVNNDQNVYTLSCEVNELSIVGTYDINGTDISDNYIVTFENGTNAYTVTKKELTITADSDTKAFDGIVLEKNSYTNTALVNGDVIEIITIVGAQTEIGTSTNEVSNAIIKKNNIDVTSCYDITYINGILTVTKAQLTITANPKTITYGDMPDNDGVSYSGFIGTDDETVLNGNLEILYNYEQFGNVGSYSIIPSGLVSSNYNIQYVNGVLSVNPLDITVTIVSKSSIYGDAQVELESSITSGELINNDTNVYSISCAVTATSDVGTYDIIGTCLNTNYNITFVGESDSYIVSKKELTITANSKTITYGDTPVNDGVSYTGFVNSETEIVLDGNLSFTYTYNQYDNVGNYLIIPNGLTSTNYDITFVNGNLTVEAKPITVTITPVTSVYGESQTELIGIADGIVNNDQNVYTLSCEVNELSIVGTYDINGTDISDNYIVTFENGTNAYTVTKKELTIIANDKTIIYKNEAQNGGVSYVGFVNNDTEAVLGGNLSFSYNYNQYDDIGNYTITPSGLTSDNYEIKFVEGTLIVIKKVITARVDEQIIKCGDELPVYTYTLSEEIADNEYDELTEKIVLTSNADSAVPGRYAILFSFKDGYNKDNVLNNYSVILKNNYIYVLSKSLKPSTSEANNDNDVEVSFEDENLVFDFDVRVEVEVKTDIKATESNIDYKEIEEKYVDKHSEIIKVYDVKLVRITTNDDGEETIEEIQPSDIVEGAVIIVKIAVPQNLVEKTFRILHIHSKDDIEFISEENIDIKDGYVYAKTDKLSEFAFVSPKDNDMLHLSFCLGWILIILDLIVAGYIFVFIKKKSDIYGLIGIILSSITVVFGIVAICLHVCLITIIGIVIATIIMLVFLMLKLKNRRSSNLREQE